MEFCCVCVVVCLIHVCSVGFVLFLNRLIPWLFHDKIRKLHDLSVPNLALAKGLHQKLPRIPHFTLGQNVIFYGTFPFSMTFDSCQDLHDFSRSGNQSFKFHDFSRFPWPHEPCENLHFVSLQPYNPNRINQGFCGCLMSRQILSKDWLVGSM